MFRELEDEDEEEEEEEEVDFKVASRLESVLLKICSGHFVVFFAEFFFCDGEPVRHTHALVVECGVKQEEFVS